MTESKDRNYDSFLRKIPLLAVANLLFFCFEFVVAIEVRSVSLFSDSIVFIEGAAVSVLISTKLNWSVPSREAFAGFSTTMLFIPTYFLFGMIAAKYLAAEIPSAAPLAVTGAVLLLANIAFLFMLGRGMFSRQVGSLHIRTHAVMNAALTWPPC